MPASKIPNQVTRQRNTKLLTIVAIPVLLIMVGILVTPSLIELNRQAKEAKKIYSKFIQALQDRQFEKAYELTGPEFRREISEAQFLQLQNDLERKYGRLLSVKERGTKVSGTGQPVFWKAQFNEDLSYEKGLRICGFGFRKYDGTWALFSYEIADPPTTN